MRDCAPPEEALPDGRSVDAHALVLGLLVGDLGREKGRRVDVVGWMGFQSRRDRLNSYEV